MTDELDNSLYKKRYGAWAGFPDGNPPDYDCCCEEVWSNERWSRNHQCGNKRGYGAEKAYCKIHDPASVKARKERSDAKYAAKYNTERYSIHGATFFRALEQIANGHNDARGLAEEVITRFKAGAK